MNFTEYTGACPSRKPNKTQKILLSVNKDSQRVRYYHNRETAQTKPKPSVASKLLSAESSNKAWTQFQNDVKKFFADGGERICYGLKFSFSNAVGSTTNTTSYGYTIDHLNDQLTSLMSHMGSSPDAVGNNPEAFDKIKILEIYDITTEGVGEYKKTMDRKAPALKLEC